MNVELCLQRPTHGGATRESWLGGGLTLAANGEHLCGGELLSTKDDRQLVATEGCVGEYIGNHIRQHHTSCSESSTRETPPPVSASAASSSLGNSLPLYDCRHARSGLLLVRCCVRRRRVRISESRKALTTSVGVTRGRLDAPRQATECEPA